MSFRNLLVIPALLCATTAIAQTTTPQTAPESEPTEAYADIINAQGTKIGTATFTATTLGVRIVLDVNQLPPGTHGIHIHTVGKCAGPDFGTAGGHLNPGPKMHGKDNPMGPHAGDLLNFDVDADGKSHTTLMADHVTLTDGPASLFHAGGTALVIHAMPDDYKTDPSGNSGARIACGVIYSHPERTTEQRSYR